MIQIGRHIEHLLSRYDCIVVPGIGAFLAYMSAAHYDEATCQYLPPTRQIGFNPQLKINDGLLAESIMRRHGLTREEANRRLNEEIEALRRQIEVTGQVAIGSIGTLIGQHKSAGTNQLTFQPATAGVGQGHANLFAPLHISPIAKTTVEEPAPRQSKPAPGKFVWISRIAAAIAILIVAVTGLVQGNQSNVGNMPQFAALDNGLSTIAETLFGQIEEPQEQSQAQPLYDNRELYIALPKQETQEPVIDTDAPYLVVVASFATTKQVEKFLALYPAVTLEVVHTDGRYRVCSASAQNIKDGEIAAQRATETFQSAWLCRNR